MMIVTFIDIFIYWQLYLMLFTRHGNDMVRWYDPYLTELFPCYFTRTCYSNVFLRTRENADIPDDAVTNTSTNFCFQNRLVIKLGGNVVYPHIYTPYRLSLSCIDTCSMWWHLNRDYSCRNDFACRATWLRTPCFPSLDGSWLSHALSWQMYEHT